MRIEGDTVNEPREVYVDCYCQDNPGLPYHVAGLAAGRRPGIFRDFVSPNTLTFSVLEQLVLFVPDGGYWQLAFVDPGASVSGIIPKLPQGPLGWWHQFHGIESNAASRGHGIKIGVIDEALSLQTDGPLAHIDNRGGQAWDAMDDRPFQSKGSGHAEMVCSVLTANPDGSGAYQGMVPGASVCFCAAGADESDRLNSARVAESINHLAGVKGCDIITFSAGDAELATPEIESALEDATDLGTLCFAAAGNQGSAVKFPAKYEDCLTVGALGRSGFAPEGTEDALEAERSTVKFGTEFLWPSSARGAGVKFLAAGASIIYTDPLGRSFSISGTSFAAPVVAGTAAIILAKDEQFQSLKRDRKRVEYALGKLRSMSVNAFPGIANIGILKA